MDRVIDLAPEAHVVLVGAAGCGKTTFARRHFSETQGVSSDHCRVMLSDNPADNRASADAFALMHFIIDKRLKRGRLTVADATNVQPDKRAALLGIASHHGRPAVAIVLDLPIEVCAERNRLRSDRSVPPAAIRSHMAQLHEQAPLFADEGFADVLRLTSPAEVDSLSVRILDGADVGTQGV